MRRLAAGEVLAVAVGAGLAGANAFVFNPPKVAAAGPRSDRFGARCCQPVSVPQGQRQEQQGGDDGEVPYGRDDQRRFWDTVSEVRVNCVS